MILEIISFVLLLAILGVLFLVLKRVAAIESPQTMQVGQEASDTLPGEVPDFETIREAFIEYIERESSILKLDDFSRDNRPEFIGYESGYRKESGHRDIWINVWMPQGLDKVSAVISIRGNSRYFQSHYQKLKEHKSEIETAFSFDTINPSEVSGGIFQLRVEKEEIDLTQKANWDTEFRWLRENLEKLYWMLRVHDTLGWDNTSSTENSSEDDIPF